MVLPAGAEAVEPAEEGRGPSGDHRCVHIILKHAGYVCTVLYSIIRIYIYDMCFRRLW